MYIHIYTIKNAVVREILIDHHRDQFSYTSTTLGIKISRYSTSYMQQEIYKGLALYIATYAYQEVGISQSLGKFGISQILVPEILGE